MKYEIGKIDYKVIFVLSLFALSFFGLSVYPKTLHSYRFLWMVWPVTLCSFILYDKKQKYGKIILLLNIFLMVNAIGCSVFRHQSILSTYSGWEMCILLSINFYFIFWSMRNSFTDYEKVLFLLSILFCVLYIVQYFIYPIAIFNSAEKALEIREIENTSDTRIRVIGQALGPIAYFMGLNKYTITKNVKYLLQTILGFSVIIMLGFRVQMAFLIFFSLFFYLKYYHFSLKLFIRLFLVSVVAFVILYNVQFVMDSYQNMVNRQASGSSLEARLNTIYYFNNLFFYNFWERIFGAGLPGREGQYLDYIKHLKENGLIFADLGIWGLSWVAGIPAVIMLIWYPIISFIRKVPSRYFYIGITLMFVLLSSTFTREIFRDGNPFLFGMMLAMQDKIIKRYDNRNSHISFLRQLRSRTSILRSETIS